MSRFIHPAAWVPTLLLLGTLTMPRAAALVEVDIEGNAFSPATVTVQVGDTVRWTNNDGVPHTSTSTGNGDDEWDSGNLSNGESYERVFETPGEFDYTCTVHPMMTGTVTVEEP
jgi:plastocyanin